jgi:hypothetical protein
MVIGKLPRISVIAGVPILSFNSSVAGEALPRELGFPGPISSVTQGGKS